MTSTGAGTARGSSPPLIGGIAIIAGTAIGAGMFSLPVVSAGMGYFWSLLCLLLTWFCMLHSALLILETNLNFPVGSSFDTFIGQTLGPRWNLLNNLALCFVLYILSYAFISGGGSIVSQTLSSALGFGLRPMLSGLLFSSLVALLVWVGTAWVGRITAIIVAGMAASFALAIAQLGSGITPALLLEPRPEYLVYSFAALPLYLASFGFHGNVPSLVKFYAGNPARISRCIVYGSLLSLLIYIVWQTVTLGQIPRSDFGGIIAQGGNIGPMVSAISSHSENRWVLILLNSFANLAVISSFLGATLGLFDYAADRFGFADDHRGRAKSTLVSFAPPTIASMFFPDGFLIAIGFAGLAATVFAIIIPAMAAKASRRTLGNPLFRVWGGNGLIHFLYGYGMLVALCHILGSAGWLPVFGH